MAITLTPQAVVALKEIIAEQGKSETALRVWVSGGGCSGLTYGMAIDDGAPEAEDKIFSQDDIKIYVDPLSLQYMEGAQVDFQNDDLGGGFKIDNPNATGSCGCGSSFKTKESEVPSGGGCGGCSLGPSS